MKVKTNNVSTYTPLEAITSQSIAVGVFCASKNCRFRMLPSHRRCVGEKVYYCVPCSYAISESGRIMTIHEMTQADKAPKRAA